jgi:hypothetical protein
MFPGRIHPAGRFFPPASTLFNTGLIFIFFGFLYSSLIYFKFKINKPRKEKENRLIPVFKNKEKRKQIE